MTQTRDDPKILRMMPYVVTRSSIIKTIAARLSDTPSHNSSRSQNGQYNLEMQEEPKVRVEACNTRGLKNSLRDVSQTVEGLDILFLSETRMRPSDIKVAEMVDDATSGSLQHSHNRGFGGVAILINPLIEHITVTKKATKNIKSIAVRV